MDPLSITASTLTILTALEAAFQLMSSLHDAPAHLEALNNEIADLTATVAETAQVLQDFQNKAVPLVANGSHLTLAVSNIRAKAQELESLFRSCLIQPVSASGEAKLSRFTWLKVKSKVQRLQAELRDARLNLSNALATFTAYVFPFPT